MNRSIIVSTSHGASEAVSASYSRSHLRVAIQDSHEALSVGVRGREKLWSIPRSKKKALVDRDVIWVPRSEWAAGIFGPSSARRPSFARALPQASWTVAEVASGENDRPTILREQAS